MQNSKIEWTHHTFNPWIGCQKVSAGCRHCYAETLMDHRYHKVQWGPTAARQRTSPAMWRKPIQWDREARTLGVRYRVFCASLADVFERNDKLIPWRADLMALIGQTPNLDWLLLTKRPENILDMVPWPWHMSRIAGNGDYLAPGGGNWPGNVWIGTTVENQEQAVKRLGYLVSIPAAVRFVSMEPLLEAVNISRWLGYSSSMVPQTGVDWVIAGGESGHGARPMHPAWARSLRDECQGAAVPFFFKRWGTWAPCPAVDERTDLTKIHRFPDGQYMQRLVKQTAGRKLDGREWNQFPDAPAQPTAAEQGPLYSAGCAL